jgi:uncharacterized membrane protein YkoI
MKKRTLVGATVVAAVTAAVAVGAGSAFARGGDDGSVSHQYTAEQADAAKAAALKATQGGTVNSMESDTENGATYEVEVTKTDGDTVDVRLDDSYKVVVIEGDSENSGS